MRAIRQQLEDNKWHYAVLLVAAAVVLAMNVLTTLKGDEYVYALTPGDMAHRCQGLADYVRTIPAQYVNANGRLADATERLLSSVLGKGLFNVLNTAAFVLLVEGILTLALGRRRKVLWLSVLLVAIGWLFPLPGETLLWMAGSVNYLWSSVLSLWLLVWLRRTPAVGSTALGVVALVWAFVAGGFNEATSVPCLLGALLYVTLNRQELRGTRRWALAGYVLGIGLILLSPALWRRLEGGGSVNVQLELAQLLSRRLLAVGYMTVRFVTPAIAIALMAHTWHRHGGWRAAGRRGLYCLIAGAYGSALLLGMVIERPYTWLVVLSLTLALRASYPWVLHLRRVVVRSVVAVSLTLSALGSAVAMQQMIVYRAYDRALMSRLSQSPRQCILPAMSSPVDSRWVSADVYDNDEPNCAYRSVYSYYYDKDNVQFLPQPLYERYHSGRMLEGAVPTRLLSADNDVGRQLLAVPGQGYALVRLRDGLPLRCDGKGRLFRDNLEQVLGKECTQRRYLLGSLKDYVPFRPYRLQLDGADYAVIDAEVDEHVTTIVLTFYSDRQKRWLTYEFNLSEP